MCPVHAVAADGHGTKRTFYVVLVCTMYFGPSRTAQWTSNHFCLRALKEHSMSRSPSSQWHGAREGVGEEGGKAGEDADGKGQG